MVNIQVLVLGVTVSFFIGILQHYLPFEYIVSLLCVTLTITTYTQRRFIQKWWMVKHTSKSEEQDIGDKSIETQSTVNKTETNFTASADFETLMTSTNIRKIKERKSEDQQENIKVDDVNTKDSVFTPDMIDEEIKCRLVNNALDDRYWSQILYKTIGVTTVKQLDYLDEDDFQTLIKFTRYNWERKALKVFLSSSSNKTETLHTHGKPAGNDQTGNVITGISTHIMQENMTTEETEQQECRLFYKENEQNTKHARNLLLEKLGLKNWYPNKLDVMNVIQIPIEKKTETYLDIPWVFLRNIMMINCHARDVLIEQHLEHLWESRMYSSDNWNFDDSKDFCETVDQQTINPLDLTVILFECSSPILKQVLTTKLFMCRLAIPFALPPKGEELPILSLWPIRPIIIEKRVKKGAIQGSALKFPCHVVSFLRLGELSISKSKLINRILSDQYHDTFFNKDCPLGTSRRLISHGMVEAAWHSTATESEDATVYLNLRGDGLHCQRQVQLLSQISSVLVVLLDIKHLTDSTEILQRLHNCRPEIVLAVDAYQKSDMDAKIICKQYLTNIKQYREKTKICKLAADRAIGSFSHIKNDMVRVIAEAVQKDAAVSLSKRLSKANGTYFTTDEDISVFKLAKQKAMNVINLIPNDCDNVKEKLVPLQGEPWQTYTEQLKANSQSLRHQTVPEAEKKINEMTKQRHKQLQAFFNQGILMKTFIDTLMDNTQTNEECILFITYLKLFLDDRSRSILPDFLGQYQKAWNALKAARDKTVSDFQSLQTNCQAAEFNLANASFGFEHLIRECGQSYEAIVACPGETSEELKSLAAAMSRICAKLLLLGQPFELMDGDAANVPLKWVQAVLEALRNMIGDKKLLTLSVLGIQSSGKSTLLNTMFGLQFAVSAGRCTRGVYIQLVPVEKGTLKFDYILVIDTEGLRATELGHQKHDHDNKLATFVIGLGDISIINVKGENTAEMKDILQIAVHAFLRLKLVNERLNLKQSCVFVHQNVPAADANDKMMQGRQKLVENLDEMTKEAAEQEQITNVRSFNQVIDFDSEKNVWYFSDLWVGDPPMAPTNPGYSKSASDVKAAVLSKVSTSRDTYFTVTDTIIRIEDLWTGILTDDFVFAFRNSLELKAYSNMEKQYQELTWEMHKFFFEFLLNEAKSFLQNSIEEDDLIENVSTIRQKLREEAEQNVEMLLSTFGSFVERSDLKDVMIQWIQTKNVRLKILKDTLLTSTDKDILNIREEKRVQILQIKEKTKHERQINELARQLANELKGERVDRELMVHKFEDMWSDWLMNFSSTIEKIDSVRSVKDEIERLAWDQFPEIANYLKKEQKNYDYDSMINLVDSLSEEDFEIGKHLEIHRTFKDILPFTTDSSSSCKDHAVEITNTIFNKIDVKLREIICQDIRFNIKYVSEIFSVIIQAIDNHNNMNSKSMKFNLLPPYKALLIVHVVRYITIAFTNKEDEYLRKHSLRGQLEEYKETAWGLFNNLVQANTEDIIAAGFFEKALVKEAKDYVLESIPLDIQNAMMLKFSHQKYSIIKAVMIYLAEEGNFDECYQYIRDPSTFVQEWMTNLMYNTIFDHTSNGKNEYVRFATIRTRAIFTEIEKSVHDATRKCKNNSTVSMITWISEFIKLKTFSLSKHSFYHVMDRSVTNILNFEQVVTAQLKNMENAVVMYFIERNKGNVEWKQNPVSKIMENLWGCKETCPFCLEPCKSTDKDHVELGIDHQCLQHRIKGLGGKYWHMSEKLTLNFCNIDVQGDEVLFRHSNVEDGKKWTNYNSYKTVYPNWYIEPTSDTCKYWMWMLCKYKKDFEEKHKKKYDSIPNRWKKIKKDEAIKSLQ